MTRLWTNMYDYACTDIKTGCNNCPMFWLGLWAPNSKPYAFGNLSALWPKAELLSDNTSLWPCNNICASECPLKCKIDL